jgi:hypothetical protein
MATMSPEEEEAAATVMKTAASTTSNAWNDGTKKEQHKEAYRTLVRSSETLRRMHNLHDLVVAKRLERPALLQKIKVGTARNGELWRQFARDMAQHQADRDRLLATMRERTRRTAPAAAAAAMAADGTNGRMAAAAAAVSSLLAEDDDDHSTRLAHFDRLLRHTAEKQGLVAENQQLLVDLSVAAREQQAIDDVVVAQNDQIMKEIILKLIALKRP